MTRVLTTGLMAGLALSFVGAKGCILDTDASLGGGVCGLPVVSGPCDAYMPSYYFNRASGRCEAFVYGGCEGNANRFPTLEACQDACGGPGASDSGTTEPDAASPQVDAGSIPYDDGGPGTPTAVYPCPTPLPGSDPIEISRSLLVGNTLTLAVAHGGGCAQHDYSVCYEPGFLESYPVQTSLRLIHDDHGDACDAYLSTTIHFDLTPLATAYNAAYQTSGGLIQTNYGMYVFGAASCEEQAQAAASQVSAASARAWLTCRNDADCKSVFVGTGCASGCTTIASSYEPPGALFEMDGKISATELSQAIETVDREICDQSLANGCPSALQPPCAPPLPLVCANGTCVAGN